MQPIFYITHTYYSWQCIIVVRMLVSADKLSLSCARLVASCLTNLWVNHLQSASRLGQLSLPPFPGQYMSSNLQLGTFVASETAEPMWPTTHVIKHCSWWAAVCSQPAQWPNNGRKKCLPSMLWAGTA